jgi:hypothetical protein
MRDLPKHGHPRCPKCQMGMLIVHGFRLDPEFQTFECLRCGNIEKPPGKHNKAAA